MEKNDNPTFENILHNGTPESQSLKFTSAYKVLKQEGNLVYEYNPLRNYRLSEPSFEYQQHTYSLQELRDNFDLVLYTKKENKEVEVSQDEVQDILRDPNKAIIWKKGSEIIYKLEPPNPAEGNLSKCPVFLGKGSVVDFDTNELQFDLEHPVNILPQWSYDGSVNLILNDGLNKPRLINTRFSPIGRNRYQIVDRKGDNDTNLYDQGGQFDIDTSLYKNVSKIPSLTYYGTISSGNLPVGNYFFYFKYSDADGNETDFIAESGLVSVFIGNEPYNIQSGFRNQNSYKGVQFLLSNLDTAYQYLTVYYTKATSDINQNETISAYRINQRYIINTTSTCSVKIMGFEDITEISIDEINLTYNLVSSAQTQELCQNMLFLGNVDKPKIDYEELTDLSLRFCPKLTSEPYNIRDIISEDYVSGSKFSNSYYNSRFIYEKTGYWKDDIYRFGVVYIMSDNSLSPVFNTRGINLQDGNKYTDISVYNEEDGERNKINYDEKTFRVLTEETDTSSGSLENIKGVVYLSDANPDTEHKIYSINFELQYNKDVYSILNSMGIKGFFFVRQKRIPTILCQAFIIGIDPESHTPVIPYNSKYIAESFIGQSGTNNEKILTHDYLSRLYELDESSVYRAAICPDYDVNAPYYNTLFNGDSFVIESNKIGGTIKRLYYDDRYYIYEPNNSTPNGTTETARIQAVEDNVKLSAIDDLMFSARAGEAEEAFRFEFIGYENKVTGATNLLRGSFGPFLGLSKGSNKNQVVNIRIPDYNSTNLSTYFEIRYQDNASFYAISDRMDLSELIKGESTDTTSTVLGPYYRGDSYICQFTHRINRNFQDPSSPTNDKIVDKNCWKENFEYTDDVLNVDKFESINLGDVNAIQLGQWFTFVVRSNYNLNIRSVDDSIPDEVALFGHARDFYPHSSLSVSGSYKIPEALCYNKGFSRTVSERYNFLVPDVPYLKDTYSTRILYSDIYINDSFKNGLRVFRGTNYRDYPMTYGSITKLVELRGNLLCVFEHGVALIPVNERAVAGEGSGGNVFINTSNVLPENPKIISDKFGSQWPESIIKTPSAIYGVDTVGKKIWRTNGTDFELLSDFKIQEFLNNNISLTERELTPIIGIRNVKAHYNAFKRDILFTFYDNLYGFEERVWNICFNELLQKWITFYSWVPSYSENIYNSYFSFDRNTSKYIAKLGISNINSSFSDGVVLDNNIIDEKPLVIEETDGTYVYFNQEGTPITVDSPDEVQNACWGSKISIVNRNLPEGNNISHTVKYIIERDNYSNYKNFKIVEYKKIQYLLFIGKYDDITSEFYVRKGNNDEEIYPNSEKYSYDLDVFKEDNGRRKWLSYEEQKNPDKPVLYLNIRASIIVNLDNVESTLEEAYSQGFINGIEVDAGYYESVIAVIPQYNMQFLTTDFWKHGQAGIIDIADKIYPTYWYGKQHPFEFEFVVADNPDKHKIFDNLEIISNNAEPESFHYEIIGDCYNFAKDKKNMYIRQEATKELYQYNGCDITYDHDYSDLESIHRPLKDSDGNEIPGLYDKSTLMPLYYSRQDTINEIEDQYHLKDDIRTKDFSALAGGEIVHYKTLDEYRIWNHAKAVDMQTKGRLRGNMQYNEDKWLVQINPINLVYKNEKSWNDLSQDIYTEYDEDGTIKSSRSLSSKKVPIELGQSPIPDEVLQKGDITYNPNDPVKNDIPENSMDRTITSWGWNDNQRQEVKLKDKWIKIRVRYTGNKLAIISAIKTLYSISYS